MCDGHAPAKAGPRTRCDGCDRPMPKAHAVHDGKAYCGTCYAREFKPVPCADCGKNVRTPGGQGPALCRSCRTKDRECLRCGKPVPRAALTLEEGVACPSCARYFKEPQPCPVCGQLSLRLERDYKAGFDQPVCGRCRNKGHITCPACRKHRRPAGSDSQGRVVCKRCLESDGHPFVCPKCGEEGQRHSASSCEACYWKEKAGRTIRTTLGNLSRGWLREAYERFCGELVDRVGAKPAARRLERYGLFFAKLDAAFEKHSDLTADRMIGLFGNDGLRRQAVPYGFLRREGLVPEETEARRELLTEEVRQRKILDAASGRWYHEVLDRYHRHLAEVSGRYQERGWDGAKRRFGPRTVTANLRAAGKFLTYLDEVHGLKEARIIDQVHLNRFMAEHPGYREGIRAFVRFLNRKVKLFRPLKVESVTRALPEGIFLDRPRYEALLGAWLRAGEGERKEALIGLFMLLYAQTIKKVVRLRVSDLMRGIDGAYRACFGRTEVALDRRVGELLERYLAERKALATMEDDWENAYLFPGRRHGGHLTESAVSEQLKKQGVSAEQLFSSALYYAYLSGMRHPKVLVRAFGITDYTAIKYLNLINPRLTEETNMRAVSNV